MLLGGLLGYVGALIQHKLESIRQRKSEFRQEKMRIYSNVLTELSTLFMDSKDIVKEMTDPIYKKTFTLRLGRILGPARLIASENLKNYLRELFDKEVAWHNSLDTKDTTELDSLAEEATNARILVENEMRKELLLSK